MRKHLMKYGFLPTMLLSLVLWSCDSLQDPAGKLTGPEVSAPSANTSGKGFTVVKENDPNIGVVTGIIGSSGGRLVLGKHELTVPRGAVSGPTTFAMTKIDGDAIRVKLTATVLTTNDVGSRGFAAPVTLRLSYDNASELPQDEGLLRIVWIRWDGVQVEQPSTVHPLGKSVTADLGHFSDYALAFP